MRHTSPPILRLCLPLVHEKLSLNWMIVSQLMNGVSLASPGPDRPLIVMFGTPQYNGFPVGTLGIPSDPTTLSEPARRAMFPDSRRLMAKLASFTLFVPITQVFRSMP